MLMRAIKVLVPILGAIAALDHFSPRIIDRWQQPALNLVLTQLDLLQIGIVTLILLLVALWLAILYTSRAPLPHFVIRAARPHELSEAVNFAELELGTGVTPPERTLEWITKNPNVYRLVFDNPIGTNESRLVGYYVALPLSRGATERLLRGEVRIADIRGEDVLAPSTRRWASLYVGGVAGNTPKSRAFVQKELEKLVLFVAPKRTKLVLARPVTSRGLDIAKKFGFSKVSSADCGELGSLFRMDVK